MPKDDSASPPDVMILVVKLARFAIVCTVAVGAVLLFMEALGSRGSDRPRLLTEGTTMTLLCVIAAEVVAAVTALTCLALWKR